MPISSDGLWPKGVCRLICDEDGLRPSAGVRSFVFNFYVESPPSRAAHVAAPVLRYAVQARSNIRITNQTALTRTPPITPATNNAMPASVSGSGHWPRSQKA